MKSSGFFFRTLLLAVFTLSLLAGVIITDYYLRHEITRKAKRYLASQGVEISTPSAISAARSGEVDLLQNLEHAGLSLGMSDARGRTPLLAAIQSKNLQAVEFLIKKDPVIETINSFTSPGRETAFAAALKDRNFELADRLLKNGADINVQNAAGIPFLVEAIQTGDGEMMNYLLEREVDLDFQGAHPTGALAEAADLGKLDLMGRLLDLGTSPNARGVSGKPLLIEAVKDQDHPRFDLLLAHDVDVNATTEDGAGMELSALSYAVGNGNVKMQEALLARKASTEVMGLSGEPLIFEVVDRLDFPTSRRLLSAGASADVASRNRMTPLGTAIQQENLEMVDVLLSSRADPSFAPEAEPSPLLQAIDLGNLAMANQLIVAGAELDTQSLLATAYERRDDPLMNLLLNAGADPESTFPGTDIRVFDAAVQDGSTGAVRTLLASGAAIGDNLWAALLTGQGDLIRLILAAGGDPRQPGPDGQDPLAFCLTSGRYKAARELLDGGANPNALYDDSETWVAKAIREGNSEVALALVEGGAEVKGMKAKDGHTFLAWSIAHRMHDVVEALLEAGVDPDTDERAPARPEFREMFDSKTFRYHLQVDRRIRPIMMAAAHRDHELAQMLMDAGANGKAYTPKYLMAAIIGSWYKDTRIQQIALLGEVPEQQPRKLVIDLSSQRGTLYENGVATFSTRVSTGKPGYRTPTGEYVISDRHRHHNSSIYGSSMPFFQRFSYAAFGIHQGYVPSYPASHGCIRLPYESARYLFGKMKVGDYCVIQH